MVLDTSCPTCGSKNTRKSSAAYEQGVSRTERSGGGGWVGTRGRAGVWRSRGSSSRVYRVAACNQPPGNILPILVGPLTFFLGVIVLTLLGGPPAVDFVLPLIGGLAAAVYVGKVTAPGFASAREQYARQWYCMQCGQKFEVPAADGDQRRTKSGPDRNGVGSHPGVRSRSCGPGSGYGSAARSQYADRIIRPVQRAKAETERDLEGLIGITSRLDGSGAFDPERPWPLDLGLVSRLASLGYLAWEQDSDCFSVTAAGRRRAEAWRNGR